MILKQSGNANILAEHLEIRFHPNEEDDTLSWLNTSDYLEKIALVTPKENADEIKNNLNATKTAGFHLVTGVILRSFQRKALVKLSPCYQNLARTQGK